MCAMRLVESRDISGTLGERKIVLIRGRVTSGAASFSVNLVCLNEDIAFHFNPRFNESPPQVVCNSCTTSRWGQEERTFTMPFCQGKPFEMSITVKAAYYEVFVNKTTFLTFDHRVPCHTVKKIQVKGDVTIEDVYFY